MTYRTIVQEAHLLDPTEGVDAANEQFRLAFTYYNALVALERSRRVKIIEVQKTLPALVTSREKFEEAREERRRLKGNKKLAKSRDPKLKALKPTKAELDAAEEVYVAAREELKRVKDEEKEKLEPLYAPINEAFNACVKALRDHRGALYWATADHVRQSWKQACAWPPKHPPKKPRPYWECPRFKAWPPGRPPQGTIAVQVINGMPVEELFQPNTLVQIGPLHPDAYNEALGRGTRRRLQYTTLRFRVASAAKGKPVWTEWPIYLHRPFPGGAIVKWVKIIRTSWNQGKQFKWKAQFYLDVPAPRQKAGDRIVAVNLGWRLIGKKELRVATWADSDGKTGELRLGEACRGRMEKANAIRSDRDKLQNALQAQLLKLGIPCEKWESPQRYHQCLREQQSGTAAHNLLAPWAARDKHLWWYERGVRAGALNYRKEQYRLLVLALAKKYAYMVIEDYTLKDIVEDPNRLKKPAGQRVQGAPSTFRQIAHSTGERLGVTVLDGASYKATQMCHLCGSKEPWDAAKKINHTCLSCGKTWDQDVNNAKNMLNRALVTINAPGWTPPKKERVSHHERLRREKAAREKAAREDEPDES